MIHVDVLLLLLAIFMILLSVSSVRGDWLMDGRNLQRTGFDDVTFSSSVSDVKYGSIDAPHFYEQLYVYNGLLYVTTHQGFSRFYASDVSLPMFDSFSGGAFGGGGNPPIPDGDYVYWNDYNEIYQFNISNLTHFDNTTNITSTYIAWRDICGSLAACTPTDSIITIHDGSVYVGTAGRSSVPSWPAGFYELNASNVSNMIDVFNSVSVSDRFYSNPCIVGNYVYFGAMSSTYSIHARPLNFVSLLGYYNNATTNMILNGPMAYSGKIFIGDQGGFFYRFNQINLILEGYVFLDDFPSTAAISNGFIYVSTRPHSGGIGKIFKLDYDLNIIASLNASLNKGFGAPVVDDGIVYVVRSDGFVLELNADDLSEIREYPCVSGSYSWSVAVTDSFVYGYYDSSTIFQIPKQGNCFDALQNQDEVAIDYGGVCGSCINNSSPSEDSMWVLYRQIHQLQPFDSSYCEESKGVVGFLIIIILIVVIIIMIIVFLVILLFFLDIFFLIGIIRRIFGRKRKKDDDKRKNI